MDGETNRIRKLMNELDVIFLWVGYYMILKLLKPGTKYNDVGHFIGSPGGLRLSCYNPA